MMYFSDITAPYPGSQSAPYIPRLEPLSPMNDGTSGQGAGQGIVPNIWNNNILKDQEHAFFAIGNRLKDLARSLDAYRGAIERANQITSRYISNLNDYNNDYNALENLKNQRLTATKRLKELIQQEKEKKQRLSKSKKLRLFFDFKENTDDKQDNIFQGLFKRKQFTALDAFLINPYAIFPKGVIYEYHNPGSNNYNALNAFNPMDGINNQFRTNTLNQVNNNSFQRNYPGGADFNYFAPLSFAKALTVEQMVFTFKDSIKMRKAWAFFLQNKWYSNGYKLKIIDVNKVEDLQESIREKERELENEKRKQDANEESIKALTDQILAKLKELEEMKEKLAIEYKIINEFTDKKQSILNEINYSNLNENIKYGYKNILNDPNLLKLLKDL
ncbi:hypothetical protein KVK12_03585 [Helicobacter pylori]|nr:hypothetical protein KVK12_03585 [Helicobacter pylori]